MELKKLEAFCKIKISFSILLTDNNLIYLLSLKAHMKIQYKRIKIKHIIFGKAQVEHDKQILLPCFLVKSSLKEGLEKMFRQQNRFNLLEIMNILLIPVKL